MFYRFFPGELTHFCMSFAKKSFYIKFPKRKESLFWTYKSNDLLVYISHYKGKLFNRTKSDIKNETNYLEF